MQNMKDHKLFPMQKKDVLIKVFFSAKILTSNYSMLKILLPGYQISMTFFSSKHILLFINYSFGTEGTVSVSCLINVKHSFLFRKMLQGKHTLHYWILTGGLFDNSLPIFESIFISMKPTLSVCTVWKKYIYLR